MWERPSPLAGYFTTCGNLNGDGTFAYRVAGLPFTVQRLVHARRGQAPQARRPHLRRRHPPRLSLGSPPRALRRQYLLHLPFVLFAIWLGGRPLVGRAPSLRQRRRLLRAGPLLLLPAIVRAVTPNNDVLAMWGLYGSGLHRHRSRPRHAGPTQQMETRIVLLTIALASPPPRICSPQSLGFIAALICMLYLAERRRSYVMQILIFSAIGALAILFAFYAFRLGALQLRLHRGQHPLLVLARSGSRFALNIANAPIASRAVAFILYLAIPPQPLLRQHRASAHAPRYSSHSSPRRPSPSPGSGRCPSSSPSSAGSSPTP